MSFIKEENYMVFDEGSALEALVSGFSVEMNCRFRIRSGSGWTGWNDKDNEAMSREELISRIKKNAETGQWVDVANLAALAWNLGYAKDGN